MLATEKLESITGALAEDLLQRTTAMTFIAKIANVSDVVNAVESTKARVLGSSAWLLTAGD